MVDVTLAQKGLLMPSPYTLAIKSHLTTLTTTTTAAAATTTTTPTTATPSLRTFFLLFYVGSQHPSG